MAQGNYRSKVSTCGRNMAGARALWRANGMAEDDFNKPVIAIANSFTQFVPGHVHLHQYGQMVKEMIHQAGGFGAEFNTIAIDDGIAMGHGGMLYSLPSRDLIADSVEYMANAHAVDALFCITNCDKITPGMLMAIMRLNIPAIIVSGGPMEAGRAQTSKGELSLDLVDAMVMAGDQNVSTDDLTRIEQNACPTCGSCSGMFTANSMNCLSEALGMALPGNGTIVATHSCRKKLFEQAVDRLLKMTKAWYEDGDDSVLPRNIATYKAFENAMRVDVAMGGSTNTVLHILGIARAAGVDFTMADIDRISRETPCICKVAPSSSYHLEDVSRAGGIPAIMGELMRAGLLNGDCKTVYGAPVAKMLQDNDVRSGAPIPFAQERALAAPGGKICLQGMSQNTRYNDIDQDSKNGCIRTVEHAYSSDGGLCVLYGNLAEAGCIVKTAGVDPSIWTFSGTARCCDSQEQAVELILHGDLKPGDVVLIRYEGPKGGPGMQEMLYPTSYLKSRHLDKDCALITDGRFSGGTSGLSIGHVSPEAAAGGLIGLVEDGDTIEINIPERRIHLAVSEEQIARRRQTMEKSGADAYQPQRDRTVTEALKVYAAMATSAADGAVRDLSLLK